MDSHIIVQLSFGVGCIELQGHLYTVTGALESGVNDDGTAPVGDAVGNDSLPEFVDESVGLVPAGAGESVGDGTI